jgi:hypothetical protein
MKLSLKEKLILEDKFWPDLLRFVEEHTKSRYDIKIYVDVFTIASLLRERFYEYADQSALNSIIGKFHKEKLTDEEALFLRRTIIAILKKNSELKNKSDFLLIRET